MISKIGVTWILSTHSHQDGSGSTTMETCCEECIGHQQVLSPWTDGMEWNGSNIWHVQIKRVSGLDCDYG